MPVIEENIFDGLKFLMEKYLQVINPSYCLELIKKKKIRII